MIFALLLVANLCFVDAFRFLRLNRLEMSARSTTLFSVRNRPYSGISTADSNYESALKDIIESENTRRERRGKELAKQTSAISTKRDKTNQPPKDTSLEIGALQDNLSIEVNREMQNTEQLLALYEHFMDALLYKNSALESEREALSELVDERRESKEESTVSEIDVIIGKKEKWVNAEQSICDQMLSCAADINSEIGECRERIAGLNVMLTKFNTASNAEDAKNISDLAALKSLLSDAAEVAAERRDTIKKFEQVFDEATSLRLVLSGDESSAQRSASIDDIYDSFDGGNSSNYKLSTRKLEGILKAQSDDEFGATTIEAVKRTTAAFFLATNSFFDASSAAIESEEGQECKSKVSGAVDEIGSFFGSVTNACTRATSVWDEEINRKSSAQLNANDSSNPLSNAFKSLSADPTIQQELQQARNSTTNATKAISSAAVGLTSKLSSELAESDNWNLALSRLAGGVSMLSTILIVGVSRVTGIGRGRELPPKGV